jgi:peptidoglycan hydrolase-like protein with peptidoglycan-binding domain
MRTTVSTQELVAGTLGYASDSSVVSAPSGGVVESVATAGARLRRGAVLARIDGQPVVLLYGRHAAWRTLVAGMTGADVGQLNANLAALGYLPSGDASSDVFGPGTEAGVRRLQRTATADSTGILLRGLLVFAPGPVRIGTASVTAGETIEAGSELLQMASARRVVSIELDAGSRDEVHAGDPVEIVLPGAQHTRGVVSRVARVATAPVTDASQSGGSNSGGGDQPATVTVTVRLRNQRVAPNLDQAPVQVAITTASVADALAVPVGALLAQADGTYAVQVVRSGMRVAVPVTTGLFSDSSDLVAITGGSLRVDDRVVVPA